MELTDTERHLVTVGDRQVEYRAAGQGPDVVLLHGLGGSADDWGPLMLRLASSYRVYAPTLPGYGGDGGRPEDPSPGGNTRFCLAFLDALDLRRVVLGGHSFGGMTAALSALAEPERIRALIMVAAGGLGRFVSPLLQITALPVVGEISARVARSRPGAALRTVSRTPLLFGRPWRAPGWWFKNQYRRAQDGRFMETTLRSLRTQIQPGGQRRVVLPDLSDLMQPALVVWGSADRVVPVAHGRLAADRLPNGRLAVIPGSGHQPQIEDPDRTVAVVRDFLATLP